MRMTWHNRDRKMGFFLRLHEALDIEQKRNRKKLELRIENIKRTSLGLPRKWMRNHKPTDNSIKRKVFLFVKQWEVLRNFEFSAKKIKSFFVCVTSQYWGFCVFWLSNLVVFLWIQREWINFSKMKIKCKFLVFYELQMPPRCGCAGVERARLRLKVEAFWRCFCGGLRLLWECWGAECLILQAEWLLTCYFAILIYFAGLNARDSNLKWHFAERRKIISQS